MVTLLLFSTEDSRTVATVQEMSVETFEYRSLSCHQQIYVFIRSHLKDILWTPTATWHSKFI